MTPLDLDLDGTAAAEAEGNSTRPRPWEASPLLHDRYARVPAPVRPSGAAAAIYVTLLAVPVLFIAIFILARTGLISHAQAPTKTPWDLAAIAVAVLLTMGMAALVSRNALARKESFVFVAERQFAPWERILVLASLPTGGLLGLLGLIAWFRGSLQIGNLVFGATAPLVLASTGLLLAMAPFAYITHRHESRVRRIEDRFPDFLRDLNESYSAGMTMSQAIRASSRGDYGELNEEIHRMANQVSWGTPFQTALQMFGERVGTPLVRRAIGLIIKATQAGGNVKDVLAAAARDAREIRALEHERRIDMSLYVIVIYISFLVFLAVTAALQGLFVPAILKVTQSAGGVDFGAISVSHRLVFNDFRFIYFDVGLVQAIGSGIVAGYMAEGSLSAGLKHASIMMAMSIVLLGIVL
ncbi:MAG: type II secretion system F family protein [Thermoplasmatota archaeon]